MALAAERDAVAAEYATAFERTFTTGAPAVTAALEAGLGWADATVEAFLTLLAGHPDTLIVRKLGAAAAEGVRCEAVRVLGAGGVRSAEGRGALAAFDGSLRDPRNRRNPGTTADLTAAALLVVILERGWRAGGEVDRLLRADR
jgi:triphosphoribosyl-dephospho-CoA synthase